MAGQAGPVGHPGQAFNKLCGAGQAASSASARPVDAWRALCAEPSADEMLFATYRAEAASQLDALAAVLTQVRSYDMTLLQRNEAHQIEQAIIAYGTQFAAPSMSLKDMQHTSQNTRAALHAVNKLLLSVQSKLWSQLTCPTQAPPAAV